MAPLRSYQDEWTKGICECCDDGPGTYCYALCCPYCAAGDVSFFLGDGYYYTCCFLPLFAPCFFGIHHVCANRDGLARKYGIHDELKGCCGCLVFSCVPCMGTLMLTQELNEIKAKGNTKEEPVPPQRLHGGQQSRSPHLHGSQQQTFRDSRQSHSTNGSSKY
jgi:Cys-rich protein (TIGR01571 family)